MIAFGFSIEETIAISGKLAPVPPMIKAIAAPILIPLRINAFKIGIAISMRRYNGIPIVAATGIANGLLFPRCCWTQVSGTHTTDTALITAPSKTYGKIRLNKDHPKLSASLSFVFEALVPQQEVVGEVFA